MIKINYGYKVFVDRLVLNFIKENDDKILPSFIYFKYKTFDSSSSRALSSFIISELNDSAYLNFKTDRTL